MSQSDLLNILSNLIRNNKNSQCRLCLNIILDDYVCLDQKISLYPNSVIKPLLLSEILCRLLGESINEEIPGLEVICTECAETALVCIRYLEKCKDTNNRLKTLFDSISNILDIDTDSIGNNKDFYIVVEELQSKTVLIDKEQINTRVTESDHYFKCSECEQIFQTLFDIKGHNLVTHNTWTCVKCYGTFASQEELINHEDHSHKHKCPDCSLYKISEESLIIHQQKSHNAYVCKDCGKTCHGLDKLHSHEEKHKTKNSCPKCGKNYHTKEFYMRHVELCLKDMIDPHPIRSSMEKCYTCEKCEKAYSTPGGLRVHKRFAHGNALPHVCPECGKTFTAPSYLKVHMIKHTGEKNFKCVICNNKFVSKEALLYHTRRHTGEKPYSCKICNERFVNASARAEHVKFKHVGPTLMCEICSRKFVTKYFLKQHISRHHHSTSKLYYGRDTALAPGLPPVEQNMKKIIIKTENS